METATAAGSARTTAETATPKRKRQNVQLTAKHVEKAKSNGRQRDIFDREVPGLTLRISAEGNRKSWTWVYYVGPSKAQAAKARRLETSPPENGEPAETRQRKRIKIGSADSTTLETARKQARSMRAALEERGIDPALAKLERQKEQTAGTFGDLFDAFLAKAKKPGGIRSWPEYERVIRKIFLPRWKNRPAKSIRRFEVKDIFDEIAAKTPPAANRALAYVSAVFSFGVEREWFELNPAWKIERKEEKSRDRCLSEDEIRELLTALAAIRTFKRTDGAAPTADDDENTTTGPAISPMIARGLEVILRTAQRPGEVFNMRRADIDREEKVWTLPASMTKNGNAHRVPLTDRVLELLDEATAAPTSTDNRYIFAGENGASVAARAKKSMSALRTAKVIGFDAHRHDLRRTAATLMEAAAVPGKHIERVLNHSDPNETKVGRVYKRHPFDDEKREALETLERRIEAILAAKDGKVLPFAR